MSSRRIRWVSSTTGDAAALGDLQRRMEGFYARQDSRLRVRPLLRRARQRLGPFPVNCQPLCLDHPDLMWPDIDAVYIASKFEVADWFRSRGCEIEFPPRDRRRFCLALLPPCAGAVDSADRRVTVVNWRSPA